MDISSVIVAARPEGAQQVKLLLEALDGVEVHTVAEDGRMIVTIESASEQDTVKIYEVISQQPGVLSVSMVYHQVESNPDEEI
ncbi:MAG: chaperone NapD [Azospira sp.]|jgi:nitrate reductase NapD|nr:chaperone NapD [Azospira sp.]